MSEFGENTSQRMMADIIRSVHNQLNRFHSFPYRSTRVIEADGSAKPVVNIQEMPRRVAFAETQGYYHVVRGTSVKIVFNIKEVQRSHLPESKFFLKFELRRRSEIFSKFPVQMVCRKYDHLILSQAGSPVQVSQICSDPTNYTYHIGDRNSPSHLYYQTPDPEQQAITCSVRLTFPCNSQCLNSVEPELRTNGLLCKEKARDVELVAILEEWTQSTVFQRTAEIKIPLWVKSALSQRDFEKERRRNDKGNFARPKTGSKKSNNRPFVGELERRLKNNLFSTEELKGIKSLLDY